jgi:hypothetical protein
MTRNMSAEAEEVRRDDPTNDSGEGFLAHRKVPACEIIDLGPTKKELKSKVQIFATPERLWSSIILRQKIRATNLTVPDSDKAANLGRIPFGILGSKGRIAKAELNRMIPNSELGWKQRRFFIPWLYEKETLFQIMRHVDGTGSSVIRTERLHGLLLPLMINAVRTARRDIQMRNMELRESAENNS